MVFAVILIQWFKEQGIVEKLVDFIHPAIDTKVHSMYIIIVHPYNRPVLHTSVGVVVLSHSLSPEMCKCVAGSVRHAASVARVLGTDGGTHPSSRNTGKVRMGHVSLCSFSCTKNA